MADKYASLAELKASEPEGSYRIEARSSGTVVALIAPHAGKIEPGTSEICRSVASGDLAYYLFEGLKPRRNGDLHITSSHFDEPQGVAIAQSAEVVVTVHGQSGEDQFVNVGGRADSLCTAIIDALNAAGFSASRQNNPMLQGCDVNNICNCGSGGQGVQLELSRGLRDLLMKDNQAMARFSSTVRSVLDGL